MSTRDPLQAALDKINALDAELARGQSPEAASVAERAVSQLADVRRDLETLRAEHEAKLAALKAKHEAELAAGIQSTLAQIEQAKIRSELESVQREAALVEQDRESYLERLNALAKELSEEIDVLLSFSRERAAAFYTKRAARETEVLERAEAAHHEARRALAKKEAEARATGQRTITQMQEIDRGLEVAREEAHVAKVAARDAKTRLDSLNAKLARCTSGG